MSKKRSISDIKRAFVDVRRASGGCVHVEFDSDVMPVGDCALQPTCEEHGPSPIRFIDLFAGCGGLSEGFILAGYTLVAHVEMNGAACYTLKTYGTSYPIDCADGLEG